jgi:hypothetical protein
MSTEPQRTCPSCGNEFSGAMEFCPVCMLHKALADGVESGESSASEEAVKPTISEQAVHRFEHYELVTGEDGKPVELGRGAFQALCWPISHRSVRVAVLPPIEVATEGQLG